MQPYELNELIFMNLVMGNQTFANGNKIYKELEVRKMRRKLYCHDFISEKEEYQRFQKELNEFQSLKKLLQLKEDYYQAFHLLKQDFHVRNLYFTYVTYMERYQNNSLVTNDRDYQWMKKKYPLIKIELENLEKEKLDGNDLREGKAKIDNVEGKILMEEYLSSTNMFPSIELFSEAHNIKPSILRGYIKALKHTDPLMYENYKRIENNKLEYLKEYTCHILDGLQEYRNEHESVDMIDYYQQYSFPHHLLYRVCGICKIEKAFPLLHQFGITTGTCQEISSPDELSEYIEIGGISFSKEEQLSILREQENEGMLPYHSILIAAVKRKVREEKNKKR